MVNHFKSYIVVRTYRTYDYILFRIQIQSIHFREVLNFEVNGRTVYHALHKMLKSDESSSNFTFKNKLPSDISSVDQLLDSVNRLFYYHLAYTTAVTWRHYASISVGSQVTNIQIFWGFMLISRI